MRLMNEEMQLVREHAEYLKVDPAFLLAVIEKESAGKFSWNVNGAQLPAIRIEGHYFHRLLRDSPDKLSAAVAQGLAHRSAGEVKNPTSYAARYAMLDRMARIDAEAAYMSISIGAGQIMGEHFALLGYTSAVAMWRDAKTPLGQIKQIILFIEKNPRILSAVRAIDFKTFARLYNGPAFRKNRYDTLLESHYKRWRRFLSGSPGQSVVVRDLDVAPWVDRIVALGFPTVRAFQEHYGLKADGIVGPITRDAVVAAETAKAKPVKDAAAVAGGAAGVATGAITIDQVVRHVEGVKPVLETLAGMSTSTVVIIAGVVVVGAISYGVYKWWKS
ncbi:endolysin [Nostoc phage NMeng1]|nr:endolysin [Nostoc phage NMeng1]